MTAPTQRIEVITRGERRRRWSIEEKREIVAESLGAGVRPSEVIHKHGITSGQLYSWLSAHPAASFARVDVVAGEREVPSASGTEMWAVATKPQTHMPALPRRVPGIARDRAARRQVGSCGRAPR